MKKDRHNLKVNAQTFEFWDYKFKKKCHLYVYGMRCDVAWYGGCKERVGESRGRKIEE